MKPIGAISLLVGAALLVVYVVAWIVLIFQHGLSDGVRLGFTLWPGNVVQFTILALVFIFGGGGFLLLKSRSKSVPENLPDNTVR
jgi:hypothetical protein